MEKINAFLEYIVIAITNCKCLTTIKNHINSATDFWDDILPVNDFTDIMEVILGYESVGIISLIFILLLGFLHYKTTSLKLKDKIFFVDIFIKMISIGLFWVGYWGLHLYTTPSILFMAIGIIIFIFLFIFSTTKEKFLLMIPYTVLSIIFINLFYAHIILALLSLCPIAIIILVVKFIFEYGGIIIASIFDIDISNIPDWKSNSSSDSNRDDDHWYNQRGTVHDQYDNDYKVGTSGDYVQDKNGNWRKVHHYSDGDPYIEDEDGNNIDLK